MGKKRNIVALGECLVEFSELEGELYRQSFAGDTLNTLFYASRLGLATGYISMLGDDPYTGGIETLLSAEQIDRSLVGRSSRTNGIYFIKRDSSPNTRLHFIRDRSAAKQAIDLLDLQFVREYILNSHVFHLSLIAIGMTENKQRLLELVGSVAGRILISLDTNYRSSVWESSDQARETLADYLPHIDLLFVTDTDDRAYHGERSTVEVIKHYQSFGVPEFAYRMGAAGSIVFSGKADGIKAIPNIEVLDTTGAGDAYNAGYLFLKLGGAAPRECGVYATACAALAIQGIGGMAKGFTKAGVEQLLQDPSD